MADERRDDRENRPRTRRRKTPRKVDHAYLRRVATWYLERWDAPPAGLRRVLMKRVRRSVEHHDTDPTQASEWVDAVVAEATAAGLVSDSRFAEQTVRRWRASGKSTRAIRAGLRAKGVPAEAIDAALAVHAEESGPVDDDWLAALRYARKRGFGPWRRRDKDADGLRKELASLGRQGFDYGLSREIIELGPDDLDASEEALWSGRGWG